MPELPEVEVGRRMAEGICRGKTIEKVYAADDEIFYHGVTPQKFVAALKGRKVVEVHRKGKQLWFELDEGSHPLFHFGMSGSFKGYRDEAERHRYCKCELLMSDGNRLGFKNARRLGRLKLRADPEHEDPIASLGFDPLAEMPGLQAFTERVQSRAATVKGLLLDQGFAAGVGNWIADEVLYHAKIDPRRRANALSDKECQALRTKLKYVVSKAVQWDADYSRFPDSWLFKHRWSMSEAKKRTVHDHHGDEVHFAKVAGRTTAWVSARQK